jgi:hypothetical protein
MTALTAIAETHRAPIHHWGDVDGGGLRIALHLCRRLPVPIVPHLMEPEISRRRGSPAAPLKLDPGAVPEAWRPLAMFLSSEECCFLEQEEIDPAAPVCE